MKLKSMILILTLTCSISTFATTRFQAGDIEEGKKWEISPTSGVASYYAKGKAGSVQFTCDLQGEEDDHCNGYGLFATIYSGKNFFNLFNPIAFQLHAGMNGPNTWVLTDTGEDSGNIKIQYACGKNVTVQCVAKKI